MPLTSKGKAGPVARRARRAFSEEFKAEAMRLVTERRAAGGSLTQVGHELDVRPDQLRDWTQQQALAYGAGTGLPGDTVEQENRPLRREIAVLRQEQAFARTRSADWPECTATEPEG